MFMTNPNQYPANAAASVASLKMAANSISPVDPREAQYQVLHDLWVDQIGVQIEKQESAWKEANKLHEALRDFTPPHPELALKKRI